MNMRRLVPTVLDGRGLNGGHGEHHAGQHGLNKPETAPTRGRGDRWRSDRVESLKLAAAACPGMVEVHTARLLGTAHGGGGLK